DPIRNVGAPGLGRGDASASGAIACGAGDRLVADREDVVADILAQAHRRADAEVRTAAQVRDQRLAVAAQVHVRVDQRGDYGGPAQVDARGALRDVDGSPRADCAEASTGDDERGVVEHGAVADDDARAFI